MSFGINGPSNKPVIQEAQQMLNNGGAGNLGYFRGEKGEGEGKHEEEIIDFSFQEDTFEHETQETEVHEGPGFFAKLIEAVLKFFENIGKKSTHSKKGDFLTLSKK